MSILGLNPAAPEPDSELRSRERYPVLRMIVGFYKVLAALSVGMGLVVGGISLFPELSSGGGRFWFLIFPAAGFISGVSFWAVAESIMVFIDIEQNTRRGAGGSGR